MRAMSEFEPRPLSGSDGGLGPVFSPDGQWLLFFSSLDSTLKRIPAAGGAPTTICPISPAPSGYSWDGDTILFAQPGAGIMRVSANGGKPVIVVRIEPSEGMPHGPQSLPEGRLLFTLARRAGNDFRWDQAQVVVQSLKTGERKTIVDGGDGRYVPTGHLVYAVGGTVFAAPFDMTTLAVTAAVPIVEGVSRATSISGGASHFAFSTSGSMAYVAGPAVPGRQDVMIFDRKGNSEALKLTAGSYAYPRVSPDGRRFALETGDAKETSISIYDAAGTSSVRRLTFGGNNRFPTWSADGRRVTFQSDRDGDRAVFWQPADGGTAERLTKPGEGASHVPESWSPDGTTLLFSEAKGNEITLWTLSARDRKVARFADVRSMNLPTEAAFSPDGRWVAYQLGVANVAEGTTYVEPFPPNGTKYQIGRGGRPAWSRDGSELFFVPAPGQFVAVKVTTQPAFAFSNPQPVPRGFGVADPLSPRPYDPMPDGRIAGVGYSGSLGSTRPTEIRVVTNWFTELKARSPLPK
jgi:serine/threonine-protein kinase